MNLHKEINRVLAPQTAWKNLKKSCDQNIQALGENHRIHDKNGEGVLWRNQPNRISPDGSLPCATVDKSNLTNEEGLSYALFNSREKKLGPYQIISYESPLLRRKKKQTEILNVKCDLVAYHEKKKQLVAVEVKLNPGSKDTSLQHGILQSMLYGYLLQHSLATAPHRLSRQVQVCLNEWCLQGIKNEPEINSVAYALAAPKAYFQESLRMHGELAEWTQKAIRIKDTQFSKFWVLEYDKIKPGKNCNRSRCIPQADFKVSFFSNVKKLAEFCQ